MPDEKLQHILVTVDDQNLEKIQDVTTALQSAGMQVDKVMLITGIITGKSTPAKIQNLLKVPGVINIELDEEMHAI